MRKFMPLEPKGLTEGADAAVYGGEPQVKVTESKDKIVVDYFFPGIYLSDDTLDLDDGKVHFTQVNVEKAGFLAESGKPLLPSFGRFVQLPGNCEFSVSTRTGDEMTLEDLVVMPAQENLTDAVGPEPESEFDRDAYASESPYPKDIAEVSGLIELDGYNGVLVHVRPVQYIAAGKKLICYGSVTVELSIKAAKKPLETNMYDRSLDREAFGNLFINPKRGIEDRTGFPVTVTPGTMRIRPFGPEFLVIFSGTLKQAAMTLIDWKNKKGLRTEGVNINDIGNTVDEIKQYIRKKRGMIFSRLRYVLLLGDVDLIASETIVGGQFGSNITDYYYSTKKDPTGDNYVMPWLSVGRMPVNTPDEANAVVEQVIRYEKNPPCDPDYYSRMTFAAFFQDNDNNSKADRGYMKTMESIREHLVTLGLDVERVYVTNSTNPQEYVDGSAVPSEVRNAIIDGNLATERLISATSEGQLIVGHRDHGTEDGWHEPSFEKQHLDGIVSEYPSIFYSLNCLTGKFDRNNSDSFAEKLLQIKGGAPSLIAATRLSHTWLNDYLMKALFDAMWAGVLPTFPGTTASYSIKNNRLGDILNYGKSYLPVKMSGNSAAIKDHFEIYHVVGDPTIELWKAPPLGISLKSFVRLRDLHILMSQCPRGGVITVWQKNRLIKRIEPSSTNIKIPLSSIYSLPLPLPIGRHGIRVCFKAPGFRFREVKV